MKPEALAPSSGSTPLRAVSLVPGEEVARDYGIPLPKTRRAVERNEVVGFRVGSTVFVDSVDLDRWRSTLRPRTRRSGR